MSTKLVLEDGSAFEGKSFGAPKSTSGELVFSTGMVGYPESLTDPSYFGQILILTYPLIGNYGVPDKKFWESDSPKISGLIVSNYIDTPSHPTSRMTLANWLKIYSIPALEIVDTRFLAQKLRDKGAMLGKIIIKKDVKWYDPNKENIVDRISPVNLRRIGNGKKTVVLIDCGAKRNIEKSLIKRGVKVIVVPWDYDPFDKLKASQFDAVVISNGPGDPKKADKTIEIIRKSLKNKVPTLGICLGHQLLALAAGGKTKKLKFGHRSQNQPCLLSSSERCYITTQNHGFAVSKIPSGFTEWFKNANDGTNEGLLHKKLPFMSVQFHPEASPGPTDTEWIFDKFLQNLK